MRVPFVAFHFVSCFRRESWHVTMLRCYDATISLSPSMPAKPPDINDLRGDRLERDEDDAVVGTPISL